MKIEIPVRNKLNYSLQALEAKSVEICSRLSNSDMIDVEQLVSMKKICVAFLELPVIQALSTRGSMRLNELINKLGEIYQRDQNATVTFVEDWMSMDETRFDVNFTQVIRDNRPIEVMIELQPRDQ